jgi:alkylation response protein AidB-like acyl-CoA dehydrogenase
MLRRQLFADEHDEFRATVKGFISKVVLPQADEWGRAQLVPDTAWKAAGALGLLGFSVPAKFGGAAVRDYRFNAVIAEEFWRACVPAVGMGFSLHNDIALPYLLDLATEEQSARWFGRLVTGEIRTAIAITEPGTGSDMSGIRTSARADGGVYRLNGSKTFISNGQSADLIIVVARTGSDPHRGLSLFVVEGQMPGLERGRNLPKIGLHAQDTSELAFRDVEVPAENLLGEEGRAFAYLSNNLPQERLCIAVSAVAGAAAAIDDTVSYVCERSVFGKPLSKMQNTRFELADMAMHVQAAQVYVDRCIEDHNAGVLSAADAASVKALTSELQIQVANRCLQLFGGYGFMLECPIAQRYLDARVQSIYGGTTEIMKEIVARDLGL